MQKPGLNNSVGGAATLQDPAAPLGSLSFSAWFGSYCWLWFQQANLHPGLRPQVDDQGFGVRKTQV